MSRNRVFMNEIRPKGRIERDMLERAERAIGWRPLDGTNLAWIYDRERHERDKQRRTLTTADDPDFRSFLR